MSERIYGDMLEKGRFLSMTTIMWTLVEAILPYHCHLHPGFLTWGRGVEGMTTYYLSNSPPPNCMEMIGGGSCSLYIMCEDNVHPYFMVK